MRAMVLAVVGLVAGCAISTDEPGAGPGGKGDYAQDGSSVRERLHALVTDHTALSYHDARDAMFGITAKFDVHDATLECVYTGRTVAPDGTHTAGGFNTEHVWPQSQGADDEPPRSDLHHLFPVDAEANSARASHPFGDAACAGAGQTQCSWQVGGSALDLGPDGMSPMFSVRLERRGDVARAKFYFAIRYELPIDDDQERVLRAWHAADAPDDRERARTEAIFALQRNRNPFITDPALVDELTDF